MTTTASRDISNLLAIDEEYPSPSQDLKGRGFSRATSCD